MDLAYKIRDGCVRDEACFYSNALQSLQRHAPFSLMSKSKYFQIMHDVFEYLLEKNRLLVACGRDDEDMIYGWVLGSHDEVSYVYVKQSFRGLGIANGLIYSLL